MEDGWVKLSYKQAIDTAARFIAFGVKGTFSDSVWIDNFIISIDQTLVQDRKRPETVLPNAKELSWLNRSLVPIHSQKNMASNLSSIYHHISQFKTVALGEVSHGSSEIYQCKDEICRFLFQKHDFSTLAIEMDMAEASKLDEYLLSGKGDPQYILTHTTYWPWKTKEFLKLLVWMRQQNERSTTKLRIIGFDIPFSMTTFEKLRDIGLKCDTAFVSQVTSINDLWITANKDNCDNLLKKIDELLAFFDRNKLAYIQKCISIDTSEVSQSIKNLKNSILYLFKKQRQDEFRDECMADNLRWFLNNNANEKIIVWGHNSHIGKAPGMMGALLSKSIPFYSIGFAIGEGEANAILENQNKIGSVRITPPSNSSYENYFIKSGNSTWFLDLKGLVINDENRWLFEPRQFRYVGAVLPRYQFTSASLRELFDGIIFIKNSTASHLLFEN